MRHRVAEVLEFRTGRIANQSRALPPEADEASDAAGRLRALDVNESWIVEAPAGSGKTGLLIQRYLALLGSPDVHIPEQVLAITFTRAATEEIRDRILEQLLSAREEKTSSNPFQKRSLELAAAVLERDRQLGWQLLQEPRRLRIQTIDALCSEIVRSLPAGASSIAALTPTENAQPLYREAAQRTLLRLGAAESAEAVLLTAAIRDLLLHRDGDLRSCETLIADMLAHREQWSELVPFSAAVLDEATLDDVTLRRLNAGLEQTIRRTLAQCARSFPPFALERLAGLAVELASAEAHPSQSSHPLQPCRDLIGPPGTEPEFLDAWKAMLRLLVRGDGEWRASFSANTIGVVTTREQRDSLKDLVASLPSESALSAGVASCLKLPAPVYPAADWKVVKALFRVLHAAVADLSLIFDERSVCDFAELSIHARRALERAETTGQQLEAAASLRHLLVDEMQDTSSRQYDLLERLTTGWDGRTRTVFLVGDPKQSIYLFRQARVERFLASMSTRRLGQIPLSLLRLTSNFRSQAALVQAANQTFAPVFASESPEDVSYTASVASRPASETAEASLVWSVQQMATDAAAQGSTLQRLRDEDALSIRTLLQGWLARPVPAGRHLPWRIAVLVRNRRSLSRLLPVLRGSDTPLPFRAIDIEALGERREVLDLLALTRALLHPGDRVAWLAVLRAPWCGLTLADLHQLTGADDSSLRSRTILRLADERLDNLSVDGQQRLRYAREILQRAVDLAGDLRLPELVERTWRSLQGDLLLNEIELGNARSFLKLLRTLDSEQGFIDPATLQERVDTLRAVPTAAPVQIELLTIHGSKGLEWDFVIVPELDRSPPPQRSELLLWEELSSGDGLLLAPVQSKGEKPSALQTWLLHVHATRAHAEHRRLLYVAATRAREELHLFGTVHTGKDGPRPRANSLLEAAWPAAQAHVAPPSEPVHLDLAASATSEEEEQVVSSSPRPLLERIAQVPAFFVSSGKKSPAAAPLRHVVQPAGNRSLVRAIGTVTHALLEYCATEIAGGVDATDLAQQSKADWHLRVRTLLLAQGVSPADLSRGMHRVHIALERTLTSPIGQWILGRHPQSGNEVALTDWTQAPRRSRVDRTFRAGDEPLSKGQTQRWIIDYKTSSPGHNDITGFFSSEQAAYREQLERYAEILRLRGEAEVTLGLWFPTLAKLVWWPAPQLGSLALSAWHVAG